MIGLDLLCLDLGLMISSPVTGSFLTGFTTAFFEMFMVNSWSRSTKNTSTLGVRSQKQYFRQQAKKIKLLPESFSHREKKRKEKFSSFIALVEFVLGSLKAVRKLLDDNQLGTESAPPAVCVSTKSQRERPINISSFVLLACTPCRWYQKPQIEFS